MIALRNQSIGRGFTGFEMAVGGQPFAEGRAQPGKVLRSENPTIRKSFTDLADRPDIRGKKHQVARQSFRKSQTERFLAGKMNHCVRVIVKFKKRFASQ